jgi:type IV secretory pathway VirB9-like protein
VYRVRYVEDTASACFAALSPDGRREIVRIVARIQLDPVPDNRVKIVQYELGTMYTTYFDPRGYWVTYHIVDNEIRIVAFGDDFPYVPISTE